MNESLYRTPRQTARWYLRSPLSAVLGVLVAAALTLGGWGLTHQPGPAAAPTDHSAVSRAARSAAVDALQQAAARADTFRASADQNQPATAALAATIHRCLTLAADSTSTVKQLNDCQYDLTVQSAKVSPHVK